VVKYLLSIGADINEVFDLESPLLIAIKNNNIKIFNLLIDAGASIELEVDDVHPLSCAIDVAKYQENISDSNKIISALIERLDDIDDIKFSNENIIFFALRLFSSSDDEEHQDFYLGLISNLSTKLSDTSIKNAEGDSIFHYIAKSSSLALLNLFFDSFELEILNSNKKTPLELALSKGDDSVILRLIAKYSEVPSCKISGKSVISCLISSGYEHYAIAYLNHITDFKTLEVDMPLLKQAINYSQNGLLEYLVLREEDLDFVHDDSTALNFAIKKKNLAAAEILLRYGANPNIAPNSVSSIHLAVQYTPELIDLLIEKGASIDAKNAEGLTSLTIACIKSDEDTCIKLVNAGANIHVDDAIRRKPIYWACSKGYYNFAKILLERGAKFNFYDRDGNYPINAAIESGHDNLIMLMLKSGAAKFHTPANKIFLELCLRNKVEAVEYLLKQGHPFEVFYTSGFCEGKTPITIAASKDYNQLAKLLINFGARGDDIIVSGPMTGKTAFEIAVDKKNDELVGYFLLRGIDKDEVDRLEEIGITHYETKKSTIIKIRTLGKSVVKSIEKSGIFSFEHLLKTCIEMELEEPIVYLCDKFKYKVFSKLLNIFDFVRSGSFLAKLIDILLESSFDKKFLSEKLTAMDSESENSVIKMINNSIPKEEITNALKPLSMSFEYVASGSSDSGYQSDFSSNEPFSPSAAASSSALGKQEVDVTGEVAHSEE
jgi:uncharacterized protein